MYGAANREVVNGSHNNIRRSHVNTDPQEYVTKLVNICLQSLFSLRAFCTVRVLIFDAPSGEIHAVGDFRAPERGFNGILCAQIVRREKRAYEIMQISA